MSERQFAPGSIATAHCLERTSPKGGPFIGTCRMCGKPGLTSAQANEWCANPNSTTEADALIKAIIGDVPETGEQQP